MDKTAVTGLVLGVLIGAVYVVWQAYDLRRQKQAAPDGGKVLTMAPWAGLRLLFVGLAWWAAFTFTCADKWWLTGSLLVAYSAPLVWQVRKLFPPRSS